MDINQIVGILAEIVKDEDARKEIYTRILEECDEYDIEDAEVGIDSAFDEVLEDFTPEEDDEEDEFEEDEDYEGDDDDSSDWDDFDSSDDSGEE